MKSRTEHLRENYTCGYEDYETAIDNSNIDMSGHDQDGLFTDQLRQ